jgi:hypothetical protein
MVWTLGTGGTPPAGSKGWAFYHYLLGMCSCSHHKNHGQRVGCGLFLVLVNCH